MKPLFLAVSLAAALLAAPWCHADELDGANDTPTPVPTVLSHPDGHGNFEFSLNGGFALAGDSSLTYPSPLGAGGGLSFYFPVDKNFSMGLMADFYILSQGVSLYEVEPIGTIIENVAQTTHSVEILYSMKYRFEGDVRPYAFGGFGLALLSTLSNQSLSGFSTSSSTLSAPTEASPMFAFGLGLDFPVEKNKSFFVQGKQSAILSSGTDINVSFTGGSSVESVSGVITYTVFELGLRIFSQ